MPNHHPDDSLLIEYAAGSLSEAKALLVATHLALCPPCRAAVREGETIAGLVLRDASYRVGTGDPRDPEVEPEVLAERQKIRANQIPEPLRSYLGAVPEQLPWSPVWLGMKEFPLTQFGGVRLLSIRGGARMPRHTHDADELTLVLQGGFSDASGHFTRGDVASADPGVDHQPQADRDQLCLCLAVEDGALRLTGWEGRMLARYEKAKSWLTRRPS